MENIHSMVMKSKFKIKISYLMIIIFTLQFTCRGQVNLSQLTGTWEESQRDYVYFKNSMISDFSEKEKKLYSGSKIVFTKDTIFAFVTYLTENTLSPVNYEFHQLKTDTLDLDGNLDDLLRRKGQNCLEIKIKVAKNNGYKQYFDNYDLYLFEDSSIALVEDFSLHYFKKISDDKATGWPKSEFGQTIIKGKSYGEVSIDNLLKNKSIIITQIPVISGNDYITIYKKNIQTNRFEPLFEVDSKSIITHRIFTFFIDSSWDKIAISIGSYENSLNEFWEVRYKFVDEVRKIKSIKSVIYLIPNNPLKMYLIKDDIVEIIEEKENWQHIRYYGKKVVEGWIKKSDVE